MDYGALIGMIGQLAGAAAGEAASSMDQAEVMRLIKSVSDEYGKIDLPQLKSLLLQKMPESKLAGIQDDPEYRAQQSAADAQLNDVIDSGGLTLADKASLNAIRNKVSRTESAGRNAILGGMAARGSLDSGAQLAAQLQENQQSAQSAAEAGEATAARSDARHFEAIRERMRNAGAGLDRTYRQESDKARANDAINAGNVAIANTAARYNATIPQQNFDNQMKKVAGASGATYATAGANAAQAQNTKDLWRGVGNMASQAGKAGYDAYKADQSQGQGQNQNSFSGSDRNTPGFDQGFGSGGSSTGSDPGEWNQYLSGEPTRPQRQVVGHRLDGTPIYGDDLR